MFEKATQEKYRFETTKGLVNTEDLWDLPLVGGNCCLDDIAKDLNRDVKENEEESFIVKKKILFMLCILTPISRSLKHKKITRAFNQSNFRMIPCIMQTWQLR